ncbi:circumsporozoite protein-like [Impatiens glandulifera]|uniref:circumsporozoite protein-like n=1 Tax=Impatiens glandulifera TaxID=253017 RepID=UPI001FB16BC1|nr:circumsporozoite protein-like [Impatiens glandulifera]
MNKVSNPNPKSTVLHNPNPKLSAHSNPNPNPNLIVHPNPTLNLNPNPNPNPNQSVHVNPNPNPNSNIHPNIKTLRKSPSPSVGFQVREGFSYSEVLKASSIGQWRHPIRFGGKIIELEDSNTNKITIICTEKGSHRPRSIHLSLVDARLLAKWSKTSISFPQNAKIRI